MTNKTIVFGKGYLGHRISNKMDCDLTGINLLEKKELADYLDHEKPDVVINAAGKTGRPNIDWCETHKQETVEGNIIAASNLCMECSKRGIYFVHIGSGGVYNGDNNGKGFNEEDEPDFYGSQFYARTKIISEKILNEFPSLLLRIQMPLDEIPHKRNLIDKLKDYSKLINAQNSMTTIPHMLDAITYLTNKRSQGIYNIVNPGTISASEIMTYYKEIIDPSHNFEMISLASLDNFTVGKRCNCYLNSDKLKKEGFELPEIHKAVVSCLKNYKNALINLKNNKY
ncbi:MAG: NAD-dependent epimerase/dehydratase family protein [Nanoarchaeota archaeon]|nr:NAD-dependent epimerase/dehydratase family protein [Nanoarchaeota archaeon]